MNLKPIDITVCLVKFFRKEYKVKNIIFGDIDNNIGYSIHNIGYSIHIEIDIDEYTDYYFEKIKIFNFQNEGFNLYTDLSSGGYPFKSFKLSTLDGKWKDFLLKETRACKILEIIE